MQLLKSRLVKNPLATAAAEPHRQILVTFQMVIAVFFIKHATGRYLHDIVLPSMPGLWFPVCLLQPLNEQYAMKIQCFLTNLR